MELLGYVLTLVMGVSLGLLGGGGSILTVPILTYLFGLNAVSATAYSLFIVGLASMVGAIGKMREGLVNLKVALVFAAPGFVGVFLARAYLIPWLPDEILSVSGFTLTKSMLIMLVFSVMMILASFSMIRDKKPKVDTQNSVEGESTKKALNYPIIGVEGLAVGLLTGFVGAGGGFLIIPVLVVMAGLSMKVAVGTSLVIIGLKSLLGFIGDVMVNPEIDWGFLLVLSLISVVGIFLGSFLSRFIAEKKLKVSFGYFVLAMGAWILFQQLKG